MSTGSGQGTPLAAETAYATLAELRASPELKLAVGETADNTLLQDLLDQVKQLIDTHTGRTFAASADSTRHFDALRDVEGLTLYLKEDLCQITSVTNGDAVVVATNEYTTTPKDATPYWRIKLLGSSGKSWTYVTDPEDAIVIVGRWACSITAPDDIKRANIMGAAALYRMAASGDSDRPIVAGGGIVIAPSQLPATFWAILQPYVRKV